MEEINNNQNVEQQPTTQPADNGKQGNERTFTQQEVDRIIKERLERDRAKRSPAEPTEAEKREAALTARESRLSCREYLLDSGLPSSLLDAFDTSDVNRFKKAVDSVSGLIAERARGMEPAPLYNNQVPPATGKPETGFERGKKHTPKQYPRHSNE